MPIVNAESRPTESVDAPRQFKRRIDRHRAIEACGKVACEFAKQLERDIPSERKSRDADWRIRTPLGDSEQRCQCILGSTCVIRQARKSPARSAVPQIHAKCSHAAFSQPRGNADHVRALVAACEAVNQECRAVAGSPAVGPIVMQHDAVAGRKIDQPRHGPMGCQRSRKIISDDRLRMSAPHKGMRPEAGDFESDHAPRFKKKPTIPRIHFASDRHLPRSLVLQT